MSGGGSYVSMDICVRGEAGAGGVRPPTRSIAGSSDKEINPTY